MEKPKRGNVGGWSTPVEGFFTPCFLLKIYSFRCNCIGTRTALPLSSVLVDSTHAIAAARRAADVKGSEGAVKVLELPVHGRRASPRSNRSRRKHTSTDHAATGSQAMSGRPSLSRAPGEHSSSFRCGLIAVRYGCSGRIM